MADDIKVISDRQDIVAIANAVRGKTGITTQMTLGEIATGINNISVGTDLPELTNPANASEIFLGKEVIDQDGNAVTGTFTIDSEVNTQEDLLAELQTALNGKIGGSGGSSSGGSVNTCTIQITSFRTRDENMLTFLTYENGEMKPVIYCNFTAISMGNTNTEAVPTTRPIVVENVICGSLITANTNNLLGCWCDGGAEYLAANTGLSGATNCVCIVKAPTEAGAIGTIDYEED